MKWTLFQKLHSISNNVFAFVCVVDCLYAVTDSSADSDGWWEQDEDKTTTETNEQHTDTAAGGQAWRLWRHGRKKDKLLPILFLPANRKKKKFYWGEGD